MERRDPHFRESVLLLLQRPLVFRLPACIRCVVLRHRIEELLQHFLIITDLCDLKSPQEIIQPDEPVSVEVNLQEGLLELEFALRDDAIAYFS